MERTKKFIEELKNNDCEVYVVEKENLRNRLIEFFGKSKKIFYRHSPLIESLALDDTLEMVEHFSEGIKYGLSEADYGIVYSGALVELANSHKEKLSSLLPEIHVAVLEEKNILEDFDDFFSKLKTPLPDITFIAGPSKTADIEKVLVKGAHGPRRLVVFIVKD